MAGELKEKDTSWAPPTPAKTARRCNGVAKKVGFESLPLHGKSECKNGGMSDNPNTRCTDGVNAGASTRKPRKRMIRHRPKVYDETKPLKPSTPKPRTPKPARQVKKKVDPSKAEGVGDCCSKRSCKRKLDYDEESCVVDQKNSKPCHGINNVSERKLRSSSRLTPLRVYGKVGSIINKRRRMRRQRMSLDKLIRLIRMVHLKSMCECVSTVMNLTWTNQKRNRSKLLIRRREISSFLGEGLEVEDEGVQHVAAAKSSDEHSRHPQDDDVVSYNVGVENCSAESGDCAIEEAETDISDHTLESNTGFQQQEGVMSKSMDLVDAFKQALADYATQKMESLHIGDGHNQLVVQDQNGHGAAVPSRERIGHGAIVPSRNQISHGAVVPRGEKIGHGAIVPSRRKLGHGAIVPSRKKLGHGAIVPSRKKIKPGKKYRGTVDIDEVTKAAWNLWMEKEGGEANKENFIDSEYWKAQKEELCKHIYSFIAMMRRILGNRPFSRWKGSVVDSVVGVFLTQNVSDSLSSSAFMALSARFPPPPVTAHNGCDGGSNNAVHETQQVKIHEPPSGDTEESSASNQFEVDVENGNETFIPTKATTKRTTKAKNEPEDNVNWDDLRKKYSPGATKRSEQNADSADWEAVRQTPVEELAKVIACRGMSNTLARKIKNFLDRLVEDHGSIDLEWLRDVPPNKAKAYLNSIDGLGLKSTECVRLLSLGFRAFPIDTNAGRVVVRLGLVPLKPLPEGLRLHELNDYPALSSVQEYMWPRMEDLDDLTYYEYHVLLVLFSKAFCTKKQPNCNACPMRGECKHYASALASSRPCLEGSQAKDTASESSTVTSQEAMANGSPPMLTNPDRDASEDRYNSCNSEPIVEFPPSPEPALPEPLGGDIEDFGSEAEIPTIILNSRVLSEDPPCLVDDDDDISKALVALSPQIASIPVPKQKYMERLRTVHHVYELPDSHPLLAGFDKREPKDPNPYLLAIWTADETTDSCQESKKACNCQEDSTTCNVGTCYSGEIVQYQKDQSVVQGTILIPCRTANRGSFPLNGTYFQINEVFADHESSRRPIDVPRKWIWNLRRRALYCGTSITSICKGMSLEEIVFCFRKGFICIRGYNVKTREAKLLARRFHVCKTRKIEN